MDSHDSAVFEEYLTVPASAVDINGHVNNVVYVQWMQDIAVRHFTAMGGAAICERIGATWVARTHFVEYKAPAFENELVRIETWVGDMQRFRSKRRYRFSRVSDQRILVLGETEWVFIDKESGRPQAIPQSVKDCFRILPEVPPMA